MTRHKKTRNHVGPGRWRKNHPYMFFPSLLHGLVKQFGGDARVLRGPRFKLEVDDESFGISVFGVAGRHGHQTLSRLLREGQVTRYWRDDADICFVAGGNDLVGLVGVDQVEVIRFDNDLVVLLEEIDETEGVTVGTTVRGNREVSKLPGLRGVLVVTGPALIDDRAGCALTQGDFHPIP